MYNISYIRGNELNRRNKCVVFTDELHAEKPETKSIGILYNIIMIRFILY